MLSNRKSTSKKINALDVLSCVFVVLNDTACEFNQYAPSNR